MIPTPHLQDEVINHGSELAVADNAAMGALPGEVSVKVEQAGQQSGRWHRLGRLACKTGVAAIAIALPPAAAVTALEVAPPAHISTPIAGANVTSKLELGHDTNTATILATTFHKHSQISFGPIDVGADIRFDYSSMGADNLDSQSLTTIIQDFSHPKSIQDQITTETRAHYESAAGTAFGVTAGLEGIGLLAVKRQRRKHGELSSEDQSLVNEHFKIPRRLGYAAVIAASGSLLVAPVHTLANGNTKTVIESDSLLESIGLSGVSISGLPNQLRELFEPQLADYLQREDEFYKAQETSFAAAFAERYGTAPLKKSSDIKRIIFADDLQGQEGPARIVGDAAQAYNADLIVIGGDTTTSGNSLETFELSSLHDHAGNVPVLINRGKHDPDVEDLKKMVKGYGNFHVADGDAHEIGGINIMGFNAPTSITLSGVTQIVNPDFSKETAEQATESLTKQVVDKACTSDKKVIVTMHDQLIGTPLAERDCANVPLVLAGREYTVQPIMQYSNTTELVSGSTGGHTKDGGLEVYNAIHSPATFFEVTINTKTQEFISADLITESASPDTSVAIDSSLPLSPAKSLATANQLMANLKNSD